MKKLIFDKTMMSNQKHFQHLQKYIY